MPDELDLTPEQEDALERAWDQVPSPAAPLSQEELAAQLLDRIQERGEWYEALVVVALDKVHGDLAQAMALADEVYGRQQAEPETNLEEAGGADVVGTGDVANANQSTYVNRSATDGPYGR